MRAREKSATGFWRPNFPFSAASLIGGTTQRQRCTPTYTAAGWDSIGHMVEIALRYGILHWLEGIISYRARITVPYSSMQIRSSLKQSIGLIEDVCKVSCRVNARRRRYSHCRVGLGHQFERWKEPLIALDNVVDISVKEYRKERSGFTNKRCN